MFNFIFTTVWQDAKGFAMAFPKKLKDDKPPKLLDQVRFALRTRHYSYSTEKSYVRWIKQYILYNNTTHPKDLGEKDINRFLTHLAVNRKVSAATQNQALCAIVFLYKKVLKTELDDFGKELIWAKKSRKIPVVFTKEEVQKVMIHMHGPYRLMAMLLYGSGLRLIECLRLRIKDLDFGYNQITVRDAKGKKDRIVPMPQSIKQEMKSHLEGMKKQHIKDLRNGYGSVEMPYALSRKYPKSEFSWNWQFVFPAHRISNDPRTGTERRHHLYETVLQRAVKTAIKKAGIVKHAGCHTFRHSFATHLLEDGYDR